MTPRYDWTPASEPPDSGRRVQVWLRGPYIDQDSYAWFEDGKYLGPVMEPLQSVTHWRDVEPPKP